MDEHHWLRKCRNRIGIKQDELAARLQVRGFEVARSSISHWENGRYEPPIHEKEFRAALADSLNLDVRSMLRIAGYEVNEVQYSEVSERAAYLIDRMDTKNQRLALKLIEQLFDDSENEKTPQNATRGS